MHGLKHLSGSMALSFALAFAAEPLRAQGAFEFGLGLDTLFDHQESLDLASIHTTVTVRDSGGGESVTEIPGDPALLNRKFDFLSELRGEGAHGSIALPALGLVRPTFHWHALSADLRLDFLDRPEPTESTSIEGRGLFYGVGFDLVTALCKQCGWFASAGYLVQNMPSFDADRSPRIAGLDLSRDQVRIRRQVRDASFRVGYGVPGARIIPYTGVRRRSTDLDIEDDLAFRGPGPDGTSEETRLNTRTKIRGDATLAVAGLDVKFGGGFLGRAEAAIGDGDRVVMVRVVYLPKIGIEERRERKSENESEKKQEKQEKKLKKRAREIAVGILARLIAIEKEYLAGWHALTVVTGNGGEPSYLVPEVKALLGKTEKELLDVMGDYPELAALGDWIGDEFGRARKELGLEVPVRTAGLGAAGALPASFSGSSPSYVLASAILQAQRKDQVISQPEADGILTRVLEWIVGTPLRAARTNDGFRTQIRFETNLGNEMRLNIYPRYYPSSDHRKTGLAPGGPWKVWIGSYSYEITKGAAPDTTPYWCDATKKTSPEFCPLELVPKGCKVMRCVRPVLDELGGHCDDEKPCQAKP